MKIEIDFNCAELFQCDTTPPPQLEVDLAYLESAPPVIAPVIKAQICLMVREAKFGVN